jgi:hypothetical protein
VNDLRGYVPSAPRQIRVPIRRRGISRHRRNDSPLYPRADIQSAALHRAVTAMPRRRRRKGGLSAALCRDRRRTVWQ